MISIKNKHRKIKCVSLNVKQFKVLTVLLCVINYSEKVNFTLNLDI